MDFTRRTLLATVAGSALAACAPKTNDSPVIVPPAAVPPMDNRPVKVEGDALPMKLKDSAAPDPAVGLVAPKVTGQSFIGIPIEVAGPAIVVIGAHWCPHCQKAENEFRPIVADYKGDVKFYFISTRVKAGASQYPPHKWLEGWRGYVVADDEQNMANNAFGASAVPTIVAIGRDGRVKAREVGSIGPERFKTLITMVEGR